MFYEKYLKYKSKYLELKYTQDGGNPRVKTYYVNMGDKDFEKKVIDELEKKKFIKGTEPPYSLIFVTHEAAFQKNMFDTKKSSMINLLRGESKELLTNKVELHKMFNDSDFMKKALFINTQDLGKVKNQLKDLDEKMMILKPLKGYKGKGIKIVYDKDQALIWFKENNEYVDWILEDYIQKPDLIDGYKFHLRTYIVVIARKKKDVQVYVSFKKFYVRAVEKYIEGDWDNKNIHDTHFKDFIQMIAFDEKLPDNWENNDRDNANKKILQMLKEVFKDNIKFKSEWGVKSGFEVFGADIIFENKKPILLEINAKMAWFPRTGELLNALFNLVIDNKQSSQFIKII